MRVFSANNESLLVIFILTICTLSESGPVNHRIKRQNACQHGTYEHEGRQCCSCGPGQRRKQDCTGTTDTVCEACDPGKYSLQTNSKTCEPCTSCSSDANLELVEACTKDKDAVCQCQKDHFSSGTSAICQPCDNCGGDENIKVPCKSPNNTVCNGEKEKPQGGTSVAVPLTVTIFIIALLAGIGVLFYRRKKKGGATLTETEMKELTDRGPEDDVEEGTSFRTDEEKEHFVDQNMAVLIQDVSVVMAIVDALQQVIFIHREIYADISTQRKHQDQMRTLYTQVLQPGGRLAKVAFYDVLKVEQHVLLERLETASRNQWPD